MADIQFHFRRGLLYLSGVVFNKLMPAWLFRARYFVVFELDNQFEDLNDAPRVVCGRCENSVERDRAAALSRIDQRQFDQPLLATGAKVDGEMIGSFWVASQYFDEHELGMRFELNESQRWLFAAMVDKSHRGGGVFPKLLRFTCRELAEQGIAGAYASVNPTNRFSLRVFRRHARRQVGAALAVRFLKWSCCYASGQFQADRIFSSDCSKKPIRLKLTESAP